MVSYLQNRNIIAEGCGTRKLLNSWLLERGALGKPKKKVTRNKIQK